MTVEDNLVNGVIRYIDRRDGEVKTETIYGERPCAGCRNPLGRLAQWLSFADGSFPWGTAAGWTSFKPGPDQAVHQQYGLDESEFDELVDDTIHSTSFSFEN
ncbi:MAG: hypothetical protein CM1200mP29_07510 [Verrucomicrobiota bacterium]|nr:MAG: hypothetical protein CM1200mP29_07510 [Verrucomicrobiota bacterium]